MGKLFKLALALFLIGVGVFAIFTAISDEPIWGSINEEEYTYSEFVYDADEFTGFNFDFSNRNFIVRVSEDDQIKVTYYETERENITVTDTGDVLRIKDDIEWVFQLFSGWNSILTDDEIFDVELYLPTSMVYDIDFDSSNGQLTINNMDNIDTLNFSTSNGRVDLIDCSITTINIYTSNGKIVLEDCDSTSLDLDTSNGTIELTRVDVTGAIIMDTSNGRLLLTDVSALSIVGDSSNQRIVAQNIDCDDVRLDTSNGDITLSIYGDKEDFEVYMDTSNGDMVYDGIEVSQERFNTGESKKIHLDTSNGDVEVIFIEE
ncbi:MAG: DUF4097 family beta strand repeat protein [Tenericutes bacterium]|nr:DUF4097 family beta strand repeat protein [Mycoplasmatota bacterium]